MHPPCHINGKDCTKRKVGCRTDCIPWIKYEVYKKGEYETKLKLTKAYWDGHLRDQARQR